MGVVDPKPSVFLQSFIQEQNGPHSSNSEMLRSILKTYLLVNASVPSPCVFRWIRVKNVLERIFHSIVLGPSKGRQNMEDRPDYSTLLPD